MEGCDTVVVQNDQRGVHLRYCTKENVVTEQYSLYPSVQDVHRRLCIEGWKQIKQCCRSNSQPWLMYVK